MPGISRGQDRFAKKPGIMDGTQQPDYEECVSFVTQAALPNADRHGKSGGV